MNEGEFSGGQVQPTPNNQGNMPEQSADTANQAILSSADAGETESAKPLFSNNAFDAPQGAISSSPDSDSGSTSHLFGNRRRSGLGRRAPIAEAQPFTPNPNAPEFFNDAMAAMTPAPQPKSNKKGLVIAIIAVVAILVIGGGILAAVLLGGGGSGQKGVVTEEQAKETLNKADVLAAATFENDMKAILSGERSDDLFFSADTKQSLDDNFAAYKRIAEAIKGYTGIKKGEGEEAKVDDKIKGIAEKMQKSVPAYEKVMARFAILVSAYSSEDSSKLNDIDNDSAKTIAKDYFDAVIGYEKFIEEKYNANGCNVEPDDMSQYPTICSTFYDEMDAYEEKIEYASENAHKILTEGIDIEPIEKYSVADDLVDISANLADSEDK